MNDIIANYKNSKVLDLTGAIFEYNLNYFRLTTEVIKQGKRTGVTASLHYLPLKQTNVSGKVAMGYYDTGLPDANGCQKLWYCEGYSDGITCYNQGYLTSNCDPSNPNPTGSDSGYDSSGAYQSGGGSYAGNPPPPAIVTNNIQDPCLKSMVDAAITRDINYDLTHSMDNIFNTNTKFNLNFIDGPFYNNDGSINYTTQGFTHKNGSVSNLNGRTIVTSMTLDIKLNSNTLPKASQEFTSAIILHEALHAYFQVTGQIDDHNVMVTNYIPWFESTLHTMYPLITPGDIEALAYSGLTDSQAFGTPPVNTSLRDYYNTVQNSYQHGSSGTPCH